MSTGTLVASWQKNAREILMVKLDTFKAQSIVDWRAWYTAGDGSLKPGRGWLTASTRFGKGSIGDVKLDNVVAALTAERLLLRQEMRQLRVYPSLCLGRGCKNSGWLGGETVAHTVPSSGMFSILPQALQCTASRS
jgi:hypothetical protein